MSISEHSPSPPLNFIESQLYHLIGTHAVPSDGTSDNSPYVRARHAVPYNESDLSPIGDFWRKFLRFAADQPALDSDFGRNFRTE